MAQEKKIKVVVASEHSSHEFNLLDDIHLQPFGLTTEQIREPDVNFDVPGYLYEEKGEASPNHPCAGSACATFIDPYGRHCSVDFISYYDRNSSTSHAEGKPHWNNEIRYVRDGQEIHRTKEFDGHVMEDAGLIILTTQYGDINREQTICRNNTPEQ